METSGSPRRRGRPPKGGAAKRASFNTRLRDSLKIQLEAEAAAAGRSLSEEIETRLEHSLSGDAAIGGPRAAALFREFGARLEGEGLGGGAWLDDLAHFQHARETLLEVFNRAEPPPDRGERLYAMAAALLKKLWDLPDEQLDAVDPRDTRTPRERLSERLAGLAADRDLPEQMRRIIRAALEAKEPADDSSP